MNSMEKISETLKQNTNITDIKIKGDLEELIQVFNSSFPNISLDGLNELLKGVKIESGSKYLYKDAIQYDALNNKIIINKELLNREGTDARHSMMKVILAMITSKGNSYGFGNSSSLQALNVGLTEVIANNLVGNDGISKYEDEQVLTNGIASSIGSDVLFEAYFNNNPDIIIRALLTRCPDMEKIESFLSQMTINMFTRNQTQVSSLCSLEKEAISMQVFDSSYAMSARTLEPTTNIKYPGTEELEQFIKLQMSSGKVIQ